MFIDQNYIKVFDCQQKAIKKVANRKEKCSHRNILE